MCNLISVKKNLPEPGKAVVTYVEPPHSDMSGWFYIAWHDGGEDGEVKWFDNSDDEEIPNVSHWMHTPNTNHIRKNIT